MLARLLDGDRVLRMFVDAVRNVMHYVNIPEYGVCLRCKWLCRVSMSLVI